MGSPTRFGIVHKVMMFLVGAGAVALALATLYGGPRPVAAQADPKGEEEDFRIGLPAYVVGDPAGRERVMYADSSVSINNICPV
ncbi:MAG TPA: hypothetical protein VIM84_10330, partial [Gemmatimonadales bacterium]